jgi:hypothetical protein
MTQRQRNIRQYIFREMMAAAQYKDPAMPLAWWQARNFWRIATNGALAHR